MGMMSPGMMGMNQMAMNQQVSLIVGHRHIYVNVKIQRRYQGASMWHIFVR